MSERGHSTVDGERSFNIKAPLLALYGGVQHKWRVCSKNIRALYPTTPPTPTRTQSVKNYVSATTKFPVMYLKLVWLEKRKHSTISKVCEQ